MLTVDRLKELMSYDPKTGVFKRRISLSGGAKAGDYPGTIDPKGYIVIKADGRAYKAHRLAWLYMTGNFPPDQVDHINNVRDDNRWKNLRQASNGENCRNAKVRTDSTSGYKGVSWHKGISKWTARISLNKKMINLGVFDDPKQAHAAYCEASKQYHGAFSRT